MIQLVFDLLSLIMKKWIFTLAILLFIIVLYYFNNKQSPTTNKTPIVSESIKQNNTTISKASIANKIKSKTSRKKKDWLEGYDESKDHTPRVDLITAFREFRKVKRCRYVIESYKNDSEPYKIFLKQLNRKSKPNQQKILSAIQKQYYDMWAESCRAFMQDDSELYTAIHERYRKRFYETKPLTKREKDFTKSWPMKEETRFINFKYDYLIDGYDIKMKKLTKAINKKIKYTRGMLSYIHINDDIKFSSRTAIEIAMYDRQLTELNGIIDGSIVIDENYLINLYQSYQSNNQKVDSFLKQNVSSEAFMTLAPLLLSNKNIEMGFYEKRYYQTLAPKVALLFACSMDYPCDSESKDMVLMCFSHPYLANELACGQSIQDYYLNYYFSPNQLTDVDQILSYLFVNYAKN